MKTRFAFAAAAACLFATVSHAQTALPAGNVDATDASVLADVLQELGYRAMLGTDGGGDPLITSSADGSEFRIYFYGCSNGQMCKSIQFSRGYDMDAGMSLEQVNVWSREYRFGKVYLDDDLDPFIEMDVNLDFGGVSRENFADTFDWWLVTVREFETF